ncbi:MAG: hypothetical protein QNJ30_18390 [Kiloniellales bacterium]|nr:hypothetical protein [Kiloniellales bacterium]
MPSAKGGRRRTGTAVLAAFALMLQALGGLPAGAEGAEAAPLPIDALVICTPEGIRILGSDGAPRQVPEGGAPAATTDPCQISCPAESCCSALSVAVATPAFAPAKALAVPGIAPAPRHRLFPLAKPGRGPPVRA